MPVKEDKKGAKEAAKNLRSLKALVDQSKWLQSAIVWTGARLEYFDGHGKPTVFPDSHRLAQTQRSINKVQEYRMQAKKVVGDLKQWTEERNNLMQRAKYIGTLGKVDFKQIQRDTNKKAKTAVVPLLNLLQAEALVADSLPQSPTRLLLKLNPDCLMQLDDFVTNAANDISGRSLAAICLGAAHRESSRKATLRFSRKEESQDQGWLIRCYKWGLEDGLNVEPALAAFILKQIDGARTLRKLTSRLNSCMTVKLSPGTMKRVLWTAGGEQLLATLNEILSIDLLVQQLVQVREDLPKKRKKRAIERIAEEKQDAESFEKKFSQLIDCLSVDDNTANNLSSLRELITMMLTEFQVTSLLRDEIIESMRCAIGLDSSLRTPFFELLTKYCRAIWGDRSSACNRVLQPNYNYRHGLHHIMKACSDPAIAEACLERKYVVHVLLHSEINDKKRIKYVLDIIDRMDLEGYGPCSHLCHLIEELGDDCNLYLDPIFDQIDKAPFSMRKHYFEVLDFCDTGRRHVKDSVAAIGRFLPYLMAATADNTDPECQCTSLASAAVAISKQLPKFENALFAILVEKFKQKRPVAVRQVDAFDPGSRLGIAFIKTGVKPNDILPGRAPANSNNEAVEQIFGDAIDIFCRHSLEHRDPLVEGMKLLREYKVFTRMIARHYRLRARRMSALVERLAMAKRYGKDAMKPFDKLQRFEQIVNFKGADQKSLKRACKKGWGEILELAPHMAPQVFSYIVSQSIIGGSQQPPQTLLKQIELSSKLEKERECLIKLIGSNPERQDLVRRLSNIEARLDSKDGIESFTAKLVSKHLTHLASDAELEALESIVHEVFMKQLKRITNNTVIPNVKLDDHLINAIVLTQDIDHNKRLLRRLIRAHCDGDITWRERIPENSAFLDSLKANGADPAKWLGYFSKTYPFDGVAGGVLSIRLENDPIKILEMGNYFDTCLSVRGPYSHSTVANAVDLNKRVAYAYDRDNKVVARKLMGINENGELIGFRVYARMEKESRTSLNARFAAFALEFAEEVGIQLSDTGYLPILTTGYWYDDGVVDWDDDDA